MWRSRLVASIPISGISSRERVISNHLSDLTKQILCREQVPFVRAHRPPILTIGGTWLLLSQLPPRNTGKFYERYDSWPLKQNCRHDNFEQVHDSRCVVRNSRWITAHKYLTRAIITFMKILKPLKPLSKVLTWNYHIKPRNYIETISLIQVWILLIE